MNYFSDKVKGPAGDHGDATVEHIAGAEQPEVATIFRESAFRYHIPLADGAYTVTLTFIALATSAPPYCATWAPAPS